MPDRPILLVGAAGILGSAVAAALVGQNVVTVGRGELDPADPDGVVRQVERLSPATLINCAADTDVEGAEQDPGRAIAVNATLAGALARGAAAAGAGMLHFSSTGCYGDWKQTPYGEDDPLRPTTAHHRSKAEGEALVLRGHPDALVLRLGWLYGGRPNQRKNFVWARLAEARGAAEIGSNPAQTGCPTSAADVAAQALALAARGHRGVFNCVGNGHPASRLDYVAAVLAAAGSSTRVVPASFTRRAAVSSNEAASNTRLRSLGADTMPEWRHSLAVFVRSLC